MTEAEIVDLIKAQSELIKSLLKMIVAAHAKIMALQDVLASRHGLDYRELVAKERSLLDQMQSAMDALGASNPEKLLQMLKNFEGPPQ